MLFVWVEIGFIILIKCILNVFIVLVYINVILFSLGFCCGKDLILWVYRIGLRKIIYWEIVICFMNFMICLIFVYYFVFRDDLINRVVL